MAYTTNTFNLISEFPIEGNYKEWVYTTTDSFPTVAAAGYFSDAGKKGVALGDIVYVINPSSPAGFVISQVSVLSGTGYSATATVAAMVLPSATTTQFGAGTGTFPEEGNLYRLVSATGINPGTINTNNVLAVYSLPASSLDQGLRGLTITAAGSFGATANNKTVNLVWNPTTAVVGSAVVGGTTIASTGVVATNGGGWWISGNVFKTGAAGSNTQTLTSNGAIAGSTHLGTTSPLTAAAVESGAILVAVTGDAVTATTDIALWFAEINAMN